MYLCTHTCGGRILLLQKLKSNCGLQLTAVFSLLLPTLPTLRAPFLPWYSENLFRLHLFSDCTGPLILFSIPVSKKMGLLFHLYSCKKLWKSSGFESVMTLHVCLKITFSNSSFLVFAFHSFTQQNYLLSPGPGCKRILEIMIRIVHLWIVYSYHVDLFTKHFLCISHLILITAQWSSCSNTHFTNEETEV